MSLSPQQRQLYLQHNARNYCTCALCRFARATSRTTSLITRALPTVREAAVSTSSPQHRQVARSCSHHCLRCTVHQSRAQALLTKPQAHVTRQISSAPTSTEGETAAERVTPANVTQPAVAKKAVNVQTAQKIIDERLATIGLEREPTLGDGNCFFHAVVSLLSRNLDGFQALPNHHATLRQQVCDFITDHYELAQEAIECEYGTLDNFIRCMRRPGTYADGNVANIVCLMFDIDLHIHTADGVMEANPQQASDSPRRRPIMHIVFIGDHWQATRPRAS